jgi:hypothetical protein
MKHRTLRWASVVALAAAAPVWAQQPPPSGTAAVPSTPAREVPRPDQLEPGVDTSATPPSNATSESSAAGGRASKDEPRASSEAKRTPKETVAKAPEKASSVASPNANAATNSSDAKTASRGKRVADKAHDSIQLDTTDITGNRELPKVLDIVPWKRSDLGDLVGKPANSLLDEVLAPVDRDVFKRENRYYDALKPDAGGTPGPGTPGPTAAGAAPAGGGKP